MSDYAIVSPGGADSLGYCGYHLVRVSLPGQGFHVGGSSLGGPPAEEAEAASGAEHGLRDVEVRKARRG